MFTSPKQPGNSCVMLLREKPNAQCFECLTEREGDWKYGWQSKQFNSCSENPTFINRYTRKTSKIFLILYHRYYLRTMSGATSEHSTLYIKTHLLHIVAPIEKSIWHLISISWPCIYNYRWASNWNETFQYFQHVFVLQVFIVETKTVTYSYRQLQ